MKIKEKIFNVLTGDETIIERELTFDEKETQTQVNSIIAQNSIIFAKIEQEKINLLEKLGITADEAKLLLS